MKETEKGEAMKIMKTAEFRAWLVRAVFGANFRANSEFRANSGQIPSKFQANSEQASQTLYISLSFCATNILGRLTTRNTLALGVKPTEKGRIGKIPRSFPSESGKSRKIRKVPRGPKKDKKGGTSPDRESPPFENPPFGGP